MKTILTKVNTVDGILYLMVISALMINQLTPILVVIGLVIVVQVWACFYVKDYYHQRFSSRWKERLLALVLCLALAAYFYFTKHTLPS